MHSQKLALILFGAAVALCISSAFASHHSHGHHSNHHDDGHHPFQPYGFGYDVNDGWGNTQYRHEKGTGPWEVKGSYGYKDAHGVHRHVDYVADKHGFRAHVRTNEPGTAPKDPAAVKMDANPRPAGHGGSSGGHGKHGGGHGGHYHTKHHEHHHGGHGHYSASEYAPVYAGNAAAAAPVY